MQYDPNNSFDILLYELFDYAGMFPPASRSFLDAVKESGSLATTLRRPWMVSGDLVLNPIHTQQLLSLSPRNYGFASPLKLCLLATTDSEHAISTICQVQSARAAGACTIEILSLEVKAASHEASSIIERYTSCAEEADAPLAIEPDLSTDGWEHELEHTISVLSASLLKPALKCRLTGPTGISPARLATAIASVCDAQLPFKVTGGLHHPIVEKTRHEYPMGFLNVAAAVMLRRSIGQSFGHSSILQLLTNEDKGAISFGTELKFREYTVPISKFRSAKESAHFSIGSCSLHEPDNDLARLFGA